MKKLVIAAFLIIGTLTVSQSKAQIGISINIGSQPAWGPTGYDYVQNYYLPAYNCYYDVARQQFIYLSGGRWIYASVLPPSFGNVNLYNTYKVVVNRANPYLNNAADIRAYRKYKNVRKPQPSIRDSRDQKYYQNNGNRYHNQWNGGNKGGGGRR